MSMHKLAQRYLEIYRDVLDAEAEERIVVKPSAFVRYFEDRLLRRPRLKQFSQTVVNTVVDTVVNTVRDTVVNTVSDTVAVLRDRVTRSDDERASGDDSVDHERER
jgi:hypothetical protein